MIDYLIEIIFKNVSIEKIGALLKDLTMGGRIILNYSHTINSENINWGREESIRSFFSENENFGLFVNLKELDKDGICLPQCGIAIYKNKKNIDVDLNFQLSDLQETEGLTKKLMNLSKSVASDYNIKEYFCGIEPAKDPDLRLFTNGNIGPISL